MGHPLLFTSSSFSNVWFASLAGVFMVMAGFKVVLDLERHLFFISRKPIQVGASCTGGALNLEWKGPLLPAANRVELPSSVSVWLHPVKEPPRAPQMYSSLIFSTSSSLAFSLFLLLPTPVPHPHSEFCICFLLCYFLPPAMISSQMWVIMRNSA